MAKALISIDYTVDFVADEGKLTAGSPKPFLRHCSGDPIGL